MARGAGVFAQGLGGWWCTGHPWVWLRFQGAPVSSTCRGRPGCHLPGLGLPSKGRSQSCVLDDSYLPPALVKGG